MHFSYNMYRFISTFIGEILIFLSKVSSVFTSKPKLIFFHKRSGRNIISTKTNQKKIWFYASSLGEAGVSKILINEIKNLSPDTKFHLSVTTDTAYESASKEIFTLADISYSPIDSIISVRHALKSIKPDLICLIETEIWPNLIVEAGRNKIPVIILNSRISNTSLPGYSKIKPLLNETFKYIKEINSASVNDSINLEKLGINKNKIQVTGNAKYDIKTNEEKTDIYKKKYLDIFNFPESSPVILCGSTREGEEEILVKTYLNLKKEFTDLKLILAPRHLHRISEIKTLLKNSNISFGLRSEKNSDKIDVAVVDTMGELKNIYAAADIVFTGGSLKNFGGQNILEPASLKKPVVFGQYMDNFKEISTELLENKGGIQTDEQGLENVFFKLLKSKNLRITTGQNAFKTIEQNRGAASLQALTAVKYIR
ncbi:MAG: 3-deoxy-D-manno-octulosonic acid transferase [Thermodesulfobacteriota bacterium]